MKHLTVDSSVVLMQGEPFECARCGHLAAALIENAQGHRYTVHVLAGTAVRHCTVVSPHPGLGAR